MSNLERFKEPWKIMCGFLSNEWPELLGALSIFIVLFLIVGVIGYFLKEVEP